MNAARLSGLAILLLLFSDSPVPSDPLPLAEPPAGTQVLFRDTFTGSASPEWTFDREGVWKVEDGFLRAQLPELKQERSFAFAGSRDWKDYSVDLDVRGVRGVDKGVAVRVDGEKRGVGLDLRSARYNDLLMYRGFEHWARAAVPNVNGTWYHVRIEVKKNRYRVYVGGELKIDFTDESSSRPRGRLALAAYTGGIGACIVDYDNVEVRTLR